MKTAAILLAGLSLVAAGTATASPRVSDVDYLRASRCRGLAEGLGGDTAGLDAFLKTAQKSRATYVLERAEAEMKRAKRETQGDRKEKVSAEFAQACVAYKGGGGGAADVTIR